MNYYEFDSQQLDNEFLEFKPVLCQVTIPKAEWMSKVLNLGDAIVVMLSNRKKYKGIVTKTNLSEVKDHMVGDIEIIRPK